MVVMDNKNQNTAQAGERIAKAIARAGLASRREAEQWIAAGRVAVNGAVVTSPALNVTARDRVEVDGAPLPKRERTRLFLYHKPRGLVTTHADPQGRPTIFERLPEDLPRLIGVGRLDLNTEGLILLTNDGGLARELELPTTGWLRRYRVRAHGTVTQPQLDEIRAGVTVDGIHYGEIDATLDRVQGANIWLTFAIREGKNREVRNVLGHLGLSVNRLIRVSFGPFQLGDLGEGEVEEVRTRVLREQLGERVIAASGADPTPPAPAAQRPEPPPERREAPWHGASHPRNAANGPGAMAAITPNRNAKTRGRGKNPRRPKSPPPAHSWRGATEHAPRQETAAQIPWQPPRRDARRTLRGQAARRPPHRSQGPSRAGRAFQGKGPLAGAARTRDASTLATGPRPPLARSRLRRATAPAAEELMRVVGGRLRGRTLAAPKSKVIQSHAIRPTADRLREALFNILLHAYDDPVTGARALDLYAGTGALDIEALSRGAAFALFVDEGAEARALLRENIATLGLGGTSRVFRRDATKLGPAHPIEPFGLAFLDPPYGQALAEKALAAARTGGWLSPGALIVVEEAVKSAFAPPEGFTELDRRRYDDTEFIFLRLI